MSVIPKISVLPQGIKTSVAILPGGNMEKLWDKTTYRPVTCVKNMGTETL